jgi:hypothetical protein
MLPESQGDATLALTPIAVPISEARKLLGNKGRSQLYEALGRGELRAIKDGSKTLVLLESIRAYMAALPPAKIAAPRPRQSQKKRRGKHAAAGRAA